MVSPAEPGALIRCGQQGIDLRVCEKAHEAARESFTRNGEHALDLRRMRRKLECGETEERVDGGQTQVTASNAQSLVLLPVIEKRDHQRRIDLFECQSVRCCAQPLLGELQELPKRVAVGTDGVRTGLALLHQALGEESLQQRSEAGWRRHGTVSQRRSSRAMASRISSGIAFRYQKVSLQCTCPR